MTVFLKAITRPHITDIEIEYDPDAVGSVGPEGPPGPKGDTGDTGPQGPAGEEEPLVWHEVVGGVGYQNGYITRSGGYRDAAYALDPIKSLLYMRGMIYGTDATDVTMFTVPVGFRPPVNVVAAIFNATYVSIQADGQVQGQVGAPFISLEGVIFSIL